MSHGYYRHQQHPRYYYDDLRHRLNTSSHRARTSSRPPPPAYHRGPSGSPRRPPVVTSEGLLGPAPGLRHPAGSRPEGRAPAQARAERSSITRGRALRKPARFVFPTGDLVQLLPKTQFDHNRRSSPTHRINGRRSGTHPSNFSRPSFTCVDVRPLARRLIHSRRVRRAEDVVVEDDKSWLPKAKRPNDPWLQAAIQTQACSIRCVYWNLYLEHLNNSVPGGVANATISASLEKFPRSSSILRHARHGKVNPSLLYPSFERWWREKTGREPTTPVDNNVAGPDPDQVRWKRSCVYYEDDEPEQDSGRNRS